MAPRVSIGIVEIFPVATGKMNSSRGPYPALSDLVHRSVFLRTPSAPRPIVLRSRARLFAEALSPEGGVMPRASETDSREKTRSHTKHHICC